MSWNGMDKFKKIQSEEMVKNVLTRARNSLVWKRCVVAVLAVLTIYVVFRDTTALSSTTTTVTTTKTVMINGSEELEASVKVYMYDLPLRFTFGIIEHFHLSRGGKPVDDITTLTYPAHQHMAEWFIFKHLQQTIETVSNSIVRRVDDPDEAELFYVPFFSSLSVVAGRTGIGYSDSAAQLALLDWLEQQHYWRNNNGRDHVIVSSDPNAYRSVVDRIKNCVMIVAGFGRLGTDQGSIIKDVVAPYMHRVSSYEGDIGTAHRPTLLYFKGARFRKEGGRIRDVMFEVLENEKGVVMEQGVQSQNDRRAASRGMHTSKFCLNPAGDTSTSCRLFDAIVSLCVPVVVSDDIDLPFEDVIDYKKIAVFVQTDKALEPGYLVSLLTQIPDEAILQYQVELRNVHHYFSFDRDTIDQIWREVTHKLPLIRLLINRHKRFRIANITRPADCSCLCNAIPNHTQFPISQFHSSI